MPDYFDPVTNKQVRGTLVAYKRNFILFLHILHVTSGIISFIKNTYYKRFQYTGDPPILDGR